MSAKPKSLQDESLKLMHREIAAVARLAETLGIDRKTLVTYGTSPLQALLLSRAGRDPNPAIAARRDAFEAYVKARMIAYRAMVPHDVPDDALMALSLCVMSNHEYVKDDEEVPSRLAGAAYGHGLFEGMMIAIGNEEIAAVARSNLARVAARASVERSPPTCRKVRDSCAME